MSAAHPAPSHNKPRNIFPAAASGCFYSLAASRPRGVREFSWCLVLMETRREMVELRAENDTFPPPVSDEHNITTLSCVMCLGFIANIVIIPILLFKRTR